LAIGGQYFIDSQGRPSYAFNSQERFLIKDVVLPNWEILRLNKRHFFYSLPIILLLIVAVVGWFATDYLGNKARQEIIGESQASVLTLSIYASATFTHIEGGVKSLAGSPWIAPALMSKRDQDIEHASSALDRYNSTLNASVSYLMDADGMTVASSNRKDPDSFLGKSYRFRPYFQEAAKGQPGRYFGLGITSGKRGFYASYPVQNRLGKVLGVVAMKKDLDDMGTFFRKYPFCFLVSPAGIIFLSSKSAMVLKSLWPLDKTVQEKLIASQQFGNKLSETVYFKKEIADGTEVTLEGKDYFVSRKVIDSDGWSIVFLTSTDRLRIYKVIGILATISVCFLIMFFSGIIYVTDRSKEAIRQSEESKRLLLHAAGEGIFGVDATGQLTFVNPAALRMLGFSVEEMLGQSVHALIHHSHEDGSNYLVEDCPMYDSYTNATANHVIDEFLWRKDGSGLPVEYSSMPIIRDGMVMGAVVTFKDITERKRVEDELKKSEERYRHILESIQEGYFEVDLAGNLTFFNDSTCRINGYFREELMGMNNRQYTDEHNAKKLFKAFNEVYGTENPTSIHDYEIIRKDKTKAYVSASISLRKDAMGNKIGFSGIIRDTTKSKQVEEALRDSEKRFRELSIVDEFTQLYNSRHFYFQLKIELDRSNRYEQPLTILLLDLDNFKAFNDTYGHVEGDQVLRRLGQVLKRSIRNTDLAFRYGGEEFTILMPMTTSADGIVTAERIRVELKKESFSPEAGKDVHMTVSIGLAQFKLQEDMKAFVHRVDQLMYQAKKNGKDRVCSES
jgi:diguanylate cyclase (GGDEF)-like protein/PAS domain S-box-containing protein